MSREGLVGSSTPRIWVGADKRGAEGSYAATRSVSPLIQSGVGKK